MINRVKFYGIGDLALGTYFPRIEEAVSSFLENSETIYNINEILEFVNIMEYIESEIFSIDWDAEYIKRLQQAKPQIQTVIAKFFRELPRDEFLDVFNEVDSLYVSNFLEQFSNYKLAKKISETDFEEAILGSKIRVSDLLQMKYFVDSYPNLTKKLFLANPINFELFLGNFTHENSRKICLPKISKERMLEFCIAYIDNDFVNPGYLDLLLQPIAIGTYLDIDHKLRQKIYKRNKEIEDEFFAKETGISSEFHLGVFSSSKSYEEALEKNNPREFLALVEKDWIDKYHDFPTLFNNLQHLYGFFSSQVISLLPSFPNIEMGVFSRTLGIKPTRYYEAAETFRTKYYLAMMKLEVFRQAISDYGIRIEDMIAWFFSDYCQETFDIKWLSLDFPSNGETITNRTKVLFTLEEEIRKQYQLLIEDGEIESELYNFIKNTPNIANLPSLVKNKYAYITDDPKAKNILKLLFSDQAGMGYINEELKEENLVNLLLKHEVKVSNFHKFQQVNLKVLQEKGIIKEDVETEILKIKNLNRFKIFQKIWSYGVVCSPHEDIKLQRELKKMESEKLIRFSEKLFAEQESDFLNFVINNKLFDNSWAIRNKYEHGAPIYENKNQYEMDNQVALLIMIIYVVKINDELNLQRIASGKKGIYSEIV